MHCKTCKHWDNQEYSGIGVRKCKNVPLFWNCTAWDNEGEGRAFLKDCKDKKAFVQDASDYYAFFLTLEDFGCVSYEKGD